MKESGVITEVKGNTAYILFERTSACAKCGACGMISGQKDITITVENTLNAKSDDKVEVEFTTKNALQSSAIAYIFPLVMLFVGVWLGYLIPQSFLSEQDAFAAILGIVFSVIAFFVLKLLNPYFKRRFAHVYTMTRIVEESERD